MCGICGAVSTAPVPPLGAPELAAMGEALALRGPDDQGSLREPGVALGSRRLAILDLSPRGHMPMATADGRYHLVHNGEIFNFRELRAELEARGRSFRSDGDTEVLLELFAERGPAILERLNGQFAFAVWDRRERTLFLARDHLGIKPLYYAFRDGRLLFASEPKALFAAGWPRRPDPESLTEIFYFRYAAGEATPYLGVRRLLPGHWLRWRDGEIEIRRWWSLDDHAPGAAPVAPRSRPPRPLAGWFRETFDDAVRLQRISDVPVGVLLSGGLDSSAVAACASLQAGGGVSSFTVRFTEPGYDEGGMARRVAERFRLDAHELVVPPAEVPGLLEEATWRLDAPLAHGNDVHTLAISRYARPRVTVLLAGEGADETMGGYVRYRPFLYPRLRGLFALGLGALDRVATLRGRWRKASRLFLLGGLERQILYSGAAFLPGELGEPTDRTAGGRPEETGPEGEYRRALCERSARLYREPVRRIMYQEQQTYLQSILDRNDRMTMGASIECRVPFLDPRLVEGLAAAPTAALFGPFPGRGKAPLRGAMAGLLPRSVLAQKKRGFGVPWHRYFREVPALRGLVETAAGSDLLAHLPIGRPAAAELCRRFLAGDGSTTSAVRQLVFMEVWWRVCVEGRGAGRPHPARSVER